MAASPSSEVTARVISTFCKFLVRGKGPLEIVIFLTRDETEIFERGKELLCFGGLAKHEIRLAKVLMRATVPWIQHQCPLVMSHRRTKLTEPPICITDVVLDIGVEGVTQGSEFERGDRIIPILCD
jgi:hypothetical protein